MTSTAHHTQPTPNLTEPQAQRLFVWADMVLSQATARIAHLPENERAPLLADKETAVALIVHLVDDLMSHLHEPEDAVVDERRLRLFKNIAWLTGQPAPPAHKPFIARFRRARAQHNQDAAFRHLFQAILISSISGGK